MRDDKKTVRLKGSGSSIGFPQVGLAANMAIPYVLLVVETQMYSGDALMSTPSEEELADT